MSEPAQLLIAAKQFDESALSQIYDLYSHDLFRYAMRTLGHRQLAEECVGETFSKFLHALQRGKGPNSNLRAYLYRVAHNWMTDQFRSKRFDESELFEESWVVKDLGLSEKVDDEREEAQVRWAISKLTPDQRQVLILKFYEGWSNKDVAEALEKPLGAVKSLQHRALASMQRLLVKTGEGA
ncbi:MAG: sigma-70 family RNA polymerase sigma factor [Chloroflexota bacterium]